MFPELLQQAGYETAFVGKWHMLRRATPRRGFDHWLSFNGQGEYFRNTWNDDGKWSRHRDLRHGRAHRPRRRLARPPARASHSC